MNMSFPTIWTSVEIAAITGGSSEQEWFATGFCINAKKLKAGDLFFATQGDDLEAIFKKGAVAAVVPHYVQDDCSLPLLKVADVYEALRAVAGAARFKTHSTVIAVQGKSERSIIGKALSAVSEIYEGGRHLSLGMANMPENCCFSLFGFSPFVRPDIAIVTDCTHVARGAIFETMPANGTVIINADDERSLEAISIAKALGIGNIYTYGRSSFADANVSEVINADNGVSLSMNIMGENISVILPPGSSHNPALLAAFLVMKLEGLSVDNSGEMVSGQTAAETNITLMNKTSNLHKAVFRVMNMIDTGFDRRMLVLDNILSPGKEEQNKTLEIPGKVDNLDLLYTHKRLSIFSNAYAAIRQGRPHMRLGKIVPDVLMPGDFVVFEKLWNSSRAVFSEALRLMPVKENQ